MLAPKESSSQNIDAIGPGSGVNGARVESTCEASSFQENVIEFPFLLHKVFDCDDSGVSTIRNLNGGGQLDCTT